MQRTLVGKELLDVPGSATRGEIQANLRDIMASNRWLGGTSAVLSHLTSLIGAGLTRQPVRILDLATGAADIPMAVARWAREHGIAVQITAVDNNPLVVEFARENTRLFQEICMDRQDILHLPYKDGSFDFAVASQIIHHLDNTQVLRLFISMNRLAIQGMVVSDLRRSAFCIYPAEIGSYLISNRLSRHDARISFHNAFTPSELKELADAAGFPCYRLYFHGPCRIALVADKRTTVCPHENGLVHRAPVAV